MPKPLTRRLFARQAAIAPLAAETVLQSRASEARLYSGSVLDDTGGPTTGAIGQTDRLWNKAHKLLRNADWLETRERRASVMGGLDPDILSLRSVSPSYKALMLARKRKQTDVEQRGLWAWARRQVGLPVDDE